MVVVVHPKVDDTTMILKQGPVRPAPELEDFQRRFNLPNYKVHTYGGEDQHEAGYDPVSEVEAHSGCSTVPQKDPNASAQSANAVRGQLSLL